MPTQSLEAPDVHAYTPMLCKAIDVVPDDDQAFVMEVKYDGWRAVCGTNDGSDLAWMTTRSGNPILTVPYLASALASYLPPDTIVDGEIIDPTRIEKAWNRVQKLCDHGTPHEPTPDNPALAYVIFDVQVIAGSDVRLLPLSERRALLTDLLAEATGPDGADGLLTLSPWLTPSHEHLLTLLEDGHEGVVVKRLDSLYANGSKNGSWCKVKPAATETMEVVITDLPHNGKGKNAGLVGSMKWKAPDGRTGRAAGMSDAERRDMTDRPERWINTVVEIAHWGLTDNGVRHPGYKRRRPDRSAGEVLNGPPTPQAVPVATTGKTRTAPAKPAARRMRNYGAMGAPKLLAAEASLVAQEGDAYQRCITSGSGDPAGDLAEVRRVIAEKGWS